MTVASECFKLSPRNCLNNICFTLKSLAISWQLWQKCFGSPTKVQQLEGTQDTAAEEEKGEGNKNLPCNSAILLPGIYPSEIKTHVYTDLYLNIHSNFMDIDNSQEMETTQRPTAGDG